MSARVTQTPHDALGLTAGDLLSMHRTLLTARLLDEASLRQNRMGRAPFVVPVSGHEGCQIGTAWPMRRGTDIWLPYYRDVLGFPQDDCPAAEGYYAGAISLPIFPAMTSVDVDRVVSELRRALP